MMEFDPPKFRSHPIIRGGHMQTIFSVRTGTAVQAATKQHFVSLSDGDSIALHENCPAGWQPGDRSMLLIHGLAGCHGSPYMVRLAGQFYDLGYRVFRMDLRGCGAGVESATQLSHAGRSDDLRAVIGFIADLTPSGPICAVAVSLGANQLLRAVGRVGAGLDEQSEWFDRLERIAVVAPPLDLKRCSDNMQRLILRPYNYYFIRLLLKRISLRVRQRQDFQAAVAKARPRTLRELDNQFTAPLSGFTDADHYYDRSSAFHVTRHNPVETLVLASADDPMVPIGCFTDDPEIWNDRTKLLISNGGGHVGFIARNRQCWMDHVLGDWFAAGMECSTP